LFSLTNHQAPRPRRRAKLIGLTACAVLALPASTALADGGIGIGGDDGGGGTTPGAKAKLVNGKALAPESAPRKVKRAIAAANEIVKGKDYCLGGGHRRWKSRCYDCSGTVSYALGKYGARVLDAPMPSGSFGSWGKRRKGDWMTVYWDSGHMFIVIAGLRLDTSQTAGKGPGWSENVRAGFANVSKRSARHWRNL
jgi:hypothetical protein